METRQELTIKFMLALASTDEAHRLFNETDEALAATMIYLRAAKLADECLKYA